jgi:hypothetical protein
MHPDRRKFGGIKLLYSLSGSKGWSAARVRVRPVSESTLRCFDSSVGRSSKMISWSYVSIHVRHFLASDFCCRFTLAASFCTRLTDNIPYKPITYALRGALLIATLDPRTRTKCGSTSNPETTFYPFQTIDSTVQLMRQSGYQEGHVL